MARQVRQNTETIHASTRQTIITTDLQLVDNGIAYPAIEHSMYKPELSEDEKVQLEWWLIELCRTREHQWFHVITSYSIHYTKLYEVNSGLS